MAPAVAECGTNRVWLSENNNLNPITRCSSGLQNEANAGEKTKTQTRLLFPWFHSTFGTHFMSSVYRRLRVCQRERGLERDGGGRLKSKLKVRVPWPLSKRSSASAANQRCLFLRPLLASQRYRIVLNASERKAASSFLSVLFDYSDVSSRK